jgi:hypothetical protein
MSAFAFFTISSFVIPLNLPPGITLWRQAGTRVPAACVSLR